MKKGIIICTALILLASCAPKDKRFCSCLTVSSEQNSAAEKLSNKDQSQVTEKEAEAFNEIRRQKDSICAPYELKSGQELIKLRESCEK